MKNIEIVENFIKSGKSCKSNNLENIKVYCNLSVLYSYNAKIAVLQNSICIINKKWLHYSKTTQTHINKVKTLCKQNNIPVEYATLCD